MTNYQQHPCEPRKFLSEEELKECCKGKKPDQPDLSKFYDKEVSQQLKEQLAEEELEQKSNDKAHGRDCNH